LANVVQISRKPAAAITPQTGEQMAEFMATLVDHDPSELPAIAAMLRSLAEKT
jgi:hypothetical protein